MAGASNLQDEAFFMPDADDDNFSCQMHCDSSSQRVTCCASRKFHAQQSAAGAREQQILSSELPHTTHSLLSTLSTHSFPLSTPRCQIKQTSLTRHLSLFHSSSPAFIDKNVLDAPAAGIEENPGEMGRPVVLPKHMSPEMKKAVDDGWTNNAFNQYVSDLISVHRSLPDPRDAWCKDTARYLTDLPKTDVIICFHNEAWSVLLRTVHSVLDRSPPELIGKIILVDDYSDMRKLCTKYSVAYFMVMLCFLFLSLFSAPEETAGGLLCCLRQGGDRAGTKSRGTDSRETVGSQVCTFACYHVSGFTLRVRRR